MNTILITCNRHTEIGDACIGDLYIDGTYFCNTLEDLPREVKIDGKTCFSAGEYEVGFREVLSRMTKRYQKKYPWFTWHLEIKDIPNFLYVYLHIGNRAKNTDGCVLLGQWINKKKPFVFNSGKTFEKFYLMVSDHLKSGGAVNYTVNNLVTDSLCVQ